MHFQEDLCGWRAELSDCFVFLKDVVSQPEYSRQKSPHSRGAVYESEEAMLAAFGRNLYEAARELEELDAAQLQHLVPLVTAGIASPRGSRLLKEPKLGEYRKLADQPDYRWFLTVYPRKLGEAENNAYLMTVSSYDGLPNERAVYPVELEYPVRSLLREHVCERVEEQHLKPRVGLSLPWSWLSPVRRAEGEHSIA